MKSHTITISVPVPQENLFGYMADINNLPEWATEFCSELKKVPGAHKVVTPGGEIFFAIEADSKTGVIDMRTSLDGVTYGVMPTRVIPLPNGECVYIVTHFQKPTTPDGQYAMECESLQKEMDGIRALFSQESVEAH